MSKNPEINTEPPGPKARRIVALDEASLATSTKCLPMVAESAEGSLVRDVDGNTYLDFASGISVLNVGHRHPKVVQAVKDQMDKLMHFAGTDFYYEAQVNLARKLCQITPGDFDKKVFLSNSGAESIEAALKIARQSTRRKQFISFIGCFHGRTFGALSLTASKPVHKKEYFPSVPGVTHIPFANCYRCPYHLEYPSCGIWCADVLEEIYFDSFLPPEEVAGLFIEPIQGEGGYIVPPDEFVQRIREITADHDILLVDDEVQAGLGRTGKLWGIDHYDVTPDIMCMAKALGSGMPVAATVFNSVLDFRNKGSHSNTYGGNLMACAAGLATIEVIEQEGLVEASTEKGEYLQKRLRELQEKYEIIGDVRGKGLMQATELVKDRETKEVAVEERDEIIEICFKKGLVLLPCGKSSIRYIPPLNVSEEHMDRALEILDSAFDAATG